MSEEQGAEGRGFRLGFVVAVATLAVAEWAMRTIEGDPPPYMLVISMASLPLGWLLISIGEAIFPHVFARKDTTPNE